MTATEWFDPLVRGMVGLILAGVVFILARWRFSRGGGPDAGNDIGLD